ncbi:resuscitation-promoting factor protein RpfC [Streptomyces calidiresistens]|uniref:LysM peptidoglycan-binding domain-containing protein n=1 Tax=Streptomyces calidiresistens TaxID=1485586 RepID=A0A7W3T1P7_9ACTN|nr:transglycosylase family protein [Streptomyces calidiresistens]MBB0229319.1 LysM peptidoglycan-binding domain-containing protein [Streptomyces calidiresistens]
MLSGSGRHRRPRQAPAFLVAAGVTGAGAALPLLGAGAAQAVDGETWDRVAQCESDGEWTADTGNGYYGGLQLPLKLWIEYGGQEFADTPDLAGRSQQIAVAERILADQGPGAFPDCAHSGGLLEAVRQAREAEAAAAERQAEAENAAPSRSRQISGIVDDTGSGAGRLSLAGTESSVEDRESTGTGAETSTGGRHRGAPDPNEAERIDEPASGRHAADRDTEDTERGTGERGGTSDRTPGDRGETGGTGDTDTTDRTGTGEGNGRGSGNAGSGKGGKDASGDTEGAVEDPAAYEVLPGDSLVSIADQQTVEGGWNALYRANETLIGSDPDRIVPGQVLSLDTSGVVGASGKAAEADLDDLGADLDDEDAAGGAQG